MLFNEQDSYIPYQTNSELQDLKFSDDQIQALMNGVGGSQLSNEKIKRWHRILFSKKNYKHVLKTNLLMKRLQLRRFDKFYQINSPKKNRNWNEINRIACYSVWLTYFRTISEYLRKPPESSQTIFISIALL